MWKVLLGCIVMIGVPSSEGADSKVVSTTYGQVRGYKDSNEDIYTFYGIPYAAAPTGTNKFMAPLAPTPWTDIFEATDKDIVCPQWKEPAYGVDITDKTVQEDCLRVNVHVPITNETNLNVLVVIHGGYFQIGYGSVLEPKKIVASTNSIVLNFNYRLGASGFLCLGTSNIPGNAGLKDQVALLNWVQANIANFGGDPGKVTLDGYSAGSAAVGLMMVSEMASGLFNKVILESGDIGAPFVMQVNPIQNAKEYARLLGFSDVDNCTALENFFLNLSIDDLQSANVFNRPDFAVLLSPCVERNVGQEKIFLEKSPQEIIQSGNFTKLPTLVGFTNMEGLLLFQNFEEWKEQMNANFSNFLPANLLFSNEEEKTEISSQIKNHYFGDTLVSSETVLNFIEYITHAVFTCPCVKTVNNLLAAGHKNVYLFNYTFFDEASTSPVEYTNVRGAQHIAETYAVSDGVNITYLDESDISNKLRDWKVMMREIWGNFIINGIPSSADIPEWTPATTDNVTFMALKESPQLEVSDSCSFLNNLFAPYYAVPNPPEETCS